MKGVCTALSLFSTVVEGQSRKFPPCNRLVFGEQPHPKAENPTLNPYICINLYVIRRGLVVNRDAYITYEILRV